jgi:type IV pilus assembly protein PilX
MPQSKPVVRHARPARGVSLIVVMVMLVVIGLMSATAIRGANSGEQATNNIRMQNLAQQYAEAALKYCEAELVKKDDERIASLAEAKIVPTSPTATAQGPWAWNDAQAWTGSSGAGQSRTTVPEASIHSTDSSFTPTKLPECVVERLALGDGSRPYAITARGFSPDYVADGSGRTTAGSVVWMQSIIYTN